MPVASTLLLGIRLRFHHHAPQQLPSGLAFHQQAADELGCNLLGGAGKVGLRECWEGLGGYGSGLGGCELFITVHVALGVNYSTS